MKQFIRPLLLTVLLCMVGTKAWAYDIAVMNADGVTIYYNYINDGKELEVTYTIYDYQWHYFYSGSVVIPEEVTYMNRTRKVTRIEEHAFYACCGLTSVTIPNSVISIGSYAFTYCDGLTSVTIGNSVTSIGSYAFYGCSDLTSVTIPNSVTKIGSYAFYDCSDLTSVTIPNSVTSIGSSAFENCYALTSVHISDLAAWCKISFADASSNPLSRAHHLYLNDTEIKDLVIPNSVTSINRYAFENCYALTSVTIPNSVTSIGESAFLDCRALTSVTIPNSVTSIGESAFLDCRALTSLTIPNSVTSIGESAFSGCSRLTSVTIPNSVTSIGEEAFWGCNNLSEVISKIENPFTIKTNTFSDNTFYNATLYVPAGTIDKYKAKDGWKKFVFVEEEKGGIKLNKSKAVIEKGKTVTLKATVTPSSLTDKSVIWESSNTSVATVTSTGKVKGVKSGTATITCTSVAAGAKAICKVTVCEVGLDKTEVIIKKGKTVTLTSTVYPSSLEDKSVTWESSDTKIATVTSNGKVKGLKAGTATISCTSVATGAKATCKVTVGCVKLDKTEVTVEKGKTTTLKATVYPETLADKSVTWKSSDKTIATVTTAGKVKGIKAGEATITCTSNATGLSATCKVTVINGTVTLNKTEAYVEKGKTMTLKATLTPTDLADKSVTWTSSDKSIATVSSSGKVKGVKYGTATITCTSKATGASATCQVTVGKVIISMSDFSLKKTRTTVLTATVYPTTLTDKSVKWTSSDKSIATVTSSGKVKGVAPGTATITCTSVATGLKGTCTVTVLSVSEARGVGGDDDGTTAIENLDESPAVVEPYDVYDLSGRKVRHQVTSLDGLPDGVYIVNGKKVLKKQ